MMKGKWISLHLAAFVLFAFALSCGGKTPPSTPSSENPSTSTSPSASGMNQLSGVEVKNVGGKPSVVVHGSQPMSPNIFKLTDPDRIIVDLTNTQLGSVKGPIAVNAGGIGQITADQFDDGPSSLSRLVVVLT